VPSYFLTLTSLQPLYGKLSDIFGRKQCLLFAYVVFGLGCLGCGMAQNMVQLCVARAVAGIGGAGMAPVVSILLSDMVPLRDRGVWQGELQSCVKSAGLADPNERKQQLARALADRLTDHQATLI